MGQRNPLVTLAASRVGLLVVNSTQTGTPTGTRAPTRPAVRPRPVPSRRYALGFQYSEPRVLIHSLLGCFFYGAFVAKMLTLTRADAPRWLLPVAGGAVFTGLVGLWLTSSLWFFTTFGIIR
ncbi:DUF6529 family protein [Kribbella sp. NPDC048915]|uniref:DUF6529 family protein n=1 Tax=Kribbella sp. NPDC048915 TaxID=3155148 RepID=UPI0033D88244